MTLCLHISCGEASMLTFHWQLLWCVSAGVLLVINSGNKGKCNFCRKESTSCPYAFYDDTGYGALHIYDFEIRRMCGWEASSFAHAAVPLLCITLHDVWVHSSSKRYVEEKFSQHVSCSGTVASSSYRNIM